MKEQKVVEINAGLDSIPMRLTVDREREREIDAVDCSVTSLCERIYRRARLTINLDALNGFC